MIIKIDAHKKITEFFNKIQQAIKKKRLLKLKIILLKKSKILIAFKKIITQIYF
jgi:hypothetical protein